MFAGIAIDLHKQVRRAIGNFGVLRVSGHGIHEHGQLHPAFDTIQVPVARNFRLRQHIDGTEPRRRLAVFQRKFLADDADIFEPVTWPDTKTSLPVTTKGT
jgi:hypothetical protein